MFSLIALFLSLIFALVQAGPYGIRTSNSYGNYQYQYPTAYNHNYYRNNYYQGYRSPYQYQQRYANNNYQNYYQNYYARPQPQPTWPQPSPLGSGINVDQYGNSYIGSKENGIYLFCNGRGCPGRG
ncbi:unnamed protein product [Caenorhabditis sp. 36 PRJEB53466]|nr:unnamed protein product [Caenorhabditis sp. 36 PRJEB53466]